MSFTKSLFLMGLGISSLATSTAGQAFDQPPEAAPATTPNSTTHSESMPELSTPAIQSLILPLIHYPDHLIRIALAASVKPEEIALAAHYLSDPSSISGEPDFGPNILSLMQHPRLLKYMSTHLVWVNELGAQYAERPQALWSAIDTARGAQVITVEPGTVTSTRRTVTYRSNPIRLWPNPEYRHHSSIWPRSQHTSWVAYGWGYAPQHKWRARHQPQWHLSNDWLFHHQRHLQKRGYRQQHPWNHRQEHRRAHKRQHRQDHRRADRQQQRLEHRQEHRREHRRKHRQDQRNDHGGIRERHREPRRHSTQYPARIEQNLIGPTRNTPREWMQGPGLLR